MMVSRIASGLLLGALALSPGLALAEEGHSLEQVVVEMAETPTGHPRFAELASISELPAWLEMVS